MSEPVPFRGRLRRSEAARWRRQVREARAKAGLRSQALATLSHEMREPLNSVLGLARLLAETRLDADQQGHLRGLIESAESLLTLVNDVLDLDRIDAGALPLVPIDFSLPHLVDSVQRILEPRAAQKGIDLQVAVAADLPRFVRGDPGRLRQILVNLVGNAIKFTDHGAVRVSLGGAKLPDGGSELTIEVNDDGIGLPPDFEARLAAGSTAAGASGRLFGGSGLGLSISRRLLQAMAGRLEAGSRPEGGAWFRATCRLEASDGGIQQSGAAVGLLRGRSLLIVSPDAGRRSSLCSIARLWRLEVRDAAGGRQALALLREAADRGQPFDLVLVDGRLADPGPEELATRLFEIPGLRATRLMLVAPAGLRGDAARARHAGYGAYLPQGVAPEMIRAGLQRLLEQPDDCRLVTMHGLQERRRQLSVLVVDDNPLNCRLAGLLLERAGHRAVMAGGGREALAHLAQDRIDLVLMDVHMPDMDGLETTRRIRALPDPTHRTVPILAVTAGAMAQDRERCLAAGMNGYLTKPIDGAGLVAGVERLAMSVQSLESRKAV